MLDYTEYDIKKIKGIDLFFFMEAERMNLIQWRSKRWYNRFREMPDKYRCPIKLS